MKIRYSKWTRDRQISVNSLKFDPDNPRIREVQGERKIIEELAETEDLAELLGKFLNYGVAPIERLVVVYEDGKPIVIEGNRRLAVYKMLLAPEKAPKKLTNLVRQVINSIGPTELPKKVGCDLPPDGAEARVYAYMKHASEKFTKKWAPIQQAIVTSKAADLDDAGAGEIELTDSQKKEARSMVELYRLAGLLSRNAGSKIKAEALRDFPYEAVKRVFLNRVVCDRLGIKATAKGLSIVGDPDLFAKFFEATIQKMGARGTREFNTEEQAIDWIEEYGYSPSSAAKCKLSDVIEGNEVDPEDEEGGQKDDADPRPPKPKPNKRKSKVFEVRITPQFQVPRLQRVLDEVERVAIDNAPNTAGVMLRCVLELAVDGGMTERGWHKPYRAWLQSNGDTLKMRIQWMRDENKFSQERDIHRLLGNLLNKAHGKATLESLNGWVHSNWCPATGVDVQAKATELTPLIQRLLAKEQQ